MNDITIANRADFSNISIIFIPSYLNILDMKFGSSLEDAENSCWMPYEPVINWFWDIENEERIIHAFFRLKCGKTILYIDRAPSIFHSARWSFS